MAIGVKRAYEQPAKSDGYRVLVDRLWPRGVSKADAAIDEWMKDIAPSAALRKWYGHDPDKWSEFKRRYARELKRHQDLVAGLRDRANKGRVTLVYAAKDTEHNNAEVLREYLTKHNHA